MPNLTDGAGGFNVADLPEVMHLEEPHTGASATQDVKREVNQYKRGPGIEAARGKVGQPGDKPQKQDAQHPQPGHQGDPALSTMKPAPTHAPSWNFSDPNNPVYRDPQNPLYPIMRKPGTPEAAWASLHALGSIWSAMLNGAETTAKIPGERWDQMSPTEKTNWAIPWRVESLIANPAGTGVPAAQAQHGDTGSGDAQQALATKAAEIFYKNLAPDVPRTLGDWNPAMFALDAAGQAPHQMGDVPTYMGGLFQIPQLLQQLKHPKPTDVGWDAELMTHLIGGTAMAAYVAAEARVPGARSASRFFTQRPALRQLEQAITKAHAIVPTGTLSEEGLQKLMQDDAQGIIDHTLQHVDGLKPRTIVEGTPKGIEAHPALDPAIPYQPPHDNPVEQQLSDQQVKQWFTQWQDQHGLKGKTFTPVEQRQVFGAQQQKEKDQFLQLMDSRHSSFLNDLNDAHRVLGGEGTITAPEQLRQHIESRSPYFTKDQINYVQNSQAWNMARFPYDLASGIAEEPALRDPRHDVGQLPEHLQDMGHHVEASLKNWLGVVHSGPYGETHHPGAALARTLIGGNREAEWAKSDLIHHLANFMHRANLYEGPAQERLIRALEGDQVARAALTPQEKVVENAHRMLFGTLRKEGIASGARKATDVQPWYVPRVAAARPQLSKKEQGVVDKELQNMPEFKAAVKGSVAKGLGSSRYGHRVQALRSDENGELRLASRYSNVFDLNAEITKQRQQLSTWLKAERGFSPKTVSHVLDAYLPMYETNLVKIWDQTLSKDLSAIHGRQAVNALEASTIQTPTGEAQMAYKELGAQDAPISEQRAQDVIQAPGNYVRLNQGAYADYKFHPEFADYLNRALKAEGKGNPLVRLEQWAVHNIMYSPMIHGLNVMSRTGKLFVTQPVEFLSAIHGWEKLNPEQKQTMFYGLKREFYQHGGLPPAKDNPFGSVSKLGMHVTGDGEFVDAPGALMASDLAPWFKHGIAESARVGLHRGFGYQHMEQGFWRKVNDFGVMAYSMEKKRAEKFLGAGSQSAKIYAADRANSWMGAVRPEAWSSATQHNVMRTLMFAPNWWRTWMELLTSKVDTAALGSSPALGRLRMQSEVRYLTGMMMWQKVTGNALNMIGSGKPQWQNQAGAQDQVDVSGLIDTKLRPAAHALANAQIPLVSDVAHGLEGVKGTDPATGGRMTMENPLGRQERDLEMVGGLASGQADWKPGDAVWGTARVAINRISPLLDAMASAGMNIDLHRTVYDNQLRHIDPKAEVGPSAAGAILSLLKNSPLVAPMSFSVSNEFEKKIREGTDAVGPWGTKLPKTIIDGMGGLAAGGLGALWTGLTGVTPAHMQAEKSRGTAPSDQQYNHLQESKTQYTQSMSTLDQQVMTGAITWDKWRQDYKAARDQYHGVLNDIFKGAPAYTGGSLGLVGQYEALADDPKNLDELGQPIPEKVRKAQADFTAGLPQDQRQGLEAELSKSQLQHPAIRIYHDTLSAYDQFQTQVAQQLRVDPSELKAALAERSAVYNDPGERKQVEAHYPWLTAYEGGKRQWETTTWAGLMYGMLYDSSTVNRWFDANGADTMRQQVTQKWLQAEGVTQ